MTAAPTAWGSSRTIHTRASSAAACGSIPTQAPADPNHVLSQFPASVRAAYDLYDEPVYKSAWANWKPKGRPPYTVYFNGYTAEAAQIVADLKKLAAHSKLIKKIVVQDNGLSTQTQIQQLQQAIQKKATIIIAYLLNSTADTPVVTAAGKAGIPVVATLNASPNKYEVSIDGNEPLQGADLMQGLASAMGDKGSLLEMQGVPGTAASDSVLKGAGIVLKNCPNITIAGNPVGNFAAATAKTATLEFLAAHPATINGAIQVGGMATGIIQAFQQTGRPVPSIGDLGATPGALAYWEQNKSSYKGVALALPFFTGVTQATYDVTTSLLAGKGLKINEILQSPLLITNKNLGQWYQSGWTINTALPYASGPNGVFYSSSYLRQFFNK